MIWIYHATSQLQRNMHYVDDELALLRLVMASLDQYHYVAHVKHCELDVAFVVTGGPSVWTNAQSMHVCFAPQPQRPSDYGDILFEQAYGYANLSTPAGFIPLVDVVERHGSLVRKTLN